MKHMTNTSYTLLPRRHFFFFLFAFLFATSAYADSVIKMACSDEELDANCMAQGRIQAIYLNNFVTIDDFNQIAYVATQIAIDKEFPKVIVNIKGGNMDAAIGIGRILRWRKASIETADISTPSIHSKCLSSCVILAAGAVKRKLSMIGIHTGYLKTDAEGIDGYQPMPTESKLRLQEYYIEMGVSNELQIIERNTPFWEMSNFFYNPSLPSEIQKIVQWGFYMP
jgi:hypothetical protein